MRGAGPILYFRGLTQQRCQLAAILVTETAQSPPPISTDEGMTYPHALASRWWQTVWRYDFSLPATGETVSYSLGKRSYSVSPPHQHGSLRVAFTACNGRETDQPGDDTPERNANWRQLAAEHQRQPFNLLLQGGDQLYADHVWHAVPALRHWKNEGCPPRVPVDAAAIDDIGDYYFESYCWLWSQTDLAPLLASIPSLMMWDDHDLIDGWGSHPPLLQNSSVFQAIGQAAREHFALFQLGCTPEELPPGIGDETVSHFGWVYRIGDVGLIGPDLRSRRTLERLMNKAGWAWFERALASLADCRQVLLVSTVPVVHVDLSLLERVLVALPGQQPYQDDLRDQWQSYAHRREWQRMITTLLDFADQQQVAVTILSGEIHLGAFGALERRQTIIHQLTSSGIVHPPPPKALARVYDWLGRLQRTVLPDTHLRMLPIPGHNMRYLAERNWLDMQLDGGKLSAQWRGETLSQPLVFSRPSPETDATRHSDAAD